MKKQDRPASAVNPVDLVASMDSLRQKRQLSIIVVLDLGRRNLTHFYRCYQSDKTTSAYVKVSRILFDTQSRGNGRTGSVGLNSTSSRPGIATD